MSSEIFRRRKILAELKRDTKRLIENFRQYPQAEKLKMLERLERGFRRDAADAGVHEQEINDAVKQIFVRQTGDVE